MFIAFAAAQHYVYIFYIFKINTQFSGDKVFNQNEFPVQ